METDERKEALELWLKKRTPFGNGQLETASADASFRRYFRIIDGGRSFIAMDAPPELEPCEPFAHIGSFMRELDINVPEIFAQDLNQG